VRTCVRACVCVCVCDTYDRRGIPCCRSVDVKLAARTCTQPFPQPFCFWPSCQNIPLLRIMMYAVHRGFNEDTGQYILCYRALLVKNCILLEQRFIAHVSLLMAANALNWREDVLVVQTIYQWWANQKSNYNAKSQIVLEKDLNLYAKSQIKSQITSSNHESFFPKSNQITNHISILEWNLKVNVPPE